MPHHQHQHHLKPCHWRCKHTYRIYPPTIDYGYDPYPYPPCSPSSAGPHNAHHRPCKWCRIWLSWLPDFTTHPFFPPLAQRYARVHQHFTHARRRHPLRVAEDISDIVDYMRAVREAYGWWARGALGALVVEMERLVEGLVDKGG